MAFIYREVAPGVLECRGVAGGEFPDGSTTLGVLTERFTIGVFGGASLPFGASNIPDNDDMVGDFSTVRPYLTAVFIDRPFSTKFEGFDAKIVLCLALLTASWETFASDAGVRN